MLREWQAGIKHSTLVLILHDRPAILASLLDRYAEDAAWTLHHHRARKVDSIVIV